MNGAADDEDRPSIFMPATDVSCALPPPRRPAGANKGGRRTNRRKHRRNVTYRKRR